MIFLCKCTIFCFLGQKDGRMVNATLHAHQIWVCVHATKKQMFAQNLLGALVVLNVQMSVFVNLPSSLSGPFYS
jgi:hypothetical protein